MNNNLRGRRLFFWLLAARPKTLGASVAPVVVGTAFALRIDEWNPVAAAICLMFALLVQIGTNFANDYFDFVKGADTKNRIGPTRAVAAGLISPRSMWLATIATFALAFLIGLALVPFAGRWIIAVGLAAIASGFFYTAGPRPLAYIGLGDLFVFIFFGIVAVSFTFYVQTGWFALEVWLAGVAIGALATNILAVNNYRDRVTDAHVGKRTLAVRFGDFFVIAQFRALSAIAFVVPIFFVLQLGFGPAMLLPLLLAPYAVLLSIRMGKAIEGPELNRLLGETGALLITYAAMFSAGVLLG